MIAKQSETEDSLICLSGPYCKLIKKENIKNIRFPENITLGEDTCFVIEIMDCLKKIVYLNQTLYYRKIKANSLSSLRKDEDVRLSAYTNWVLEHCAGEPDKERAASILNAKNMLRICNNYLSNITYIQYGIAVKHIENYKKHLKRNLKNYEIFRCPLKLSTKIKLFASCNNMYLFVFLYNRFFNKNKYKKER